MMYRCPLCYSDQTTRCGCELDCPVRECSKCAHRGHFVEFDPRLAALDFENLRRALVAGQYVPRRECSLCGGAIGFLLVDGRPHVLSCSCRWEGSKAAYEIRWDDLRNLVETGSWLPPARPLR